MADWLATVTDSAAETFSFFKLEYKQLKQSVWGDEKPDPVFEGAVKDFIQFDHSLTVLHNEVLDFMASVTAMCDASNSLAKSVRSTLGALGDAHAAAESDKLVTAAAAIGHSPSSALSKLKRDMQFNIVDPVAKHLVNNKRLVDHLGSRHRLLCEMRAAKEGLDRIKAAGAGKSDQKYRDALSIFKAAAGNFRKVDRLCFEWLYIIEQYKADILDSAVQTTKYLQYEFFASAAHAVSDALPARIEFRPMVEMVPDLLDEHVMAELDRDDAEDDGDMDDEGVAGDAPSEEAKIDAAARQDQFSKRMIERMAGDECNELNAAGALATPAVAVDVLSLASLQAHGFPESKCRQALRLHENDTQAALDFLVAGGGQPGASGQGAADGVRMPSSAKRLAKLRERRKELEQAKTAKRAEEDAKKSVKEEERAARRAEKKARRKRGRAKASDSEGETDGGSNGDDSEAERRERRRKREKKEKKSKKIRRKRGDSDDEEASDSDDDVAAVAAAVPAAPVDSDSSGGRRERRNKEKKEKKEKKSKKDRRRHSDDDGDGGADLLGGVGSATASSSAAPVAAPATDDLLVNITSPVPAASSPAPAAPAAPAAAPAVQSSDPFASLL